MSAASVAPGVVTAPGAGLGPVDAAWRKRLWQRVRRVLARPCVTGGRIGQRLVERMVVPWACAMAVVAACASGVIAGSVSGPADVQMGTRGTAGPAVMVQERWVTIPEGGTLWEVVTGEYPGVDPRAAVVAVRRANGLSDAATLQAGAQIRLPRALP